jgi:hypothetical protein
MRVPRATGLALLLVICYAVTAHYAFGNVHPDQRSSALLKGQDPVEVKAHKDAVSRYASEPAVVSESWIKEIQEMVRTVSHRESKPVEIFQVIFNRDGSLAHLLLSAATDPESESDLNPKTGHRSAGADYDAKDKKLRLLRNSWTGVIGFPVAFSIDQLPVVCRELIPLRKLQLAFIANRLDYVIDANCASTNDNRSWVWSVHTSEPENQSDIDGMTFHPITGELEVETIDDQEIAVRVVKAVKEAGLVLKWVPGGV